MNFLNNMSLKWKMALGSSITIVLMLGVATTVTLSLSKLLDSNAWVNQTYQSITMGESLSGSLGNMETGLRGYLVTGQEEFLKPYEIGKKTFEKIMAKSKTQASTSADQITRLDLVESLANKWQVEHFDIAIAYRQEVNQGAVADREFKTIASRSIGKEVFDRFRGSLNELDKRFEAADDMVGRRLVGQLLTEMINEETSERGFLLTGDESSLDIYYSSTDLFDKNVKNLRKLISNAYDRKSVLRDLERLKTISIDWIDNVAIKGMRLKRKSRVGGGSEVDFREFTQRDIGRKYMSEAKSITRKLDLIFRNSNDPIARGMINILAKNMLDMESGYLAYLLIGTKESMEPYKTGQWIFNINVDVLINRVQQAYNPKELNTLLGKSVSLAQDWRTLAAEPEIAARMRMNKVTKTLDDVTLLIKKGIGKKYMDEMRNVLDEFIAEETALINIRNQEQVSTADFTKELTIVGTLLALFISALITFFIVGSITRSLSSAVLIANRIEHDDLDSDIDTSSQDEIGKLMVSLSQMQNNLKIRINAERAVAAENDRIKQSLDSVSGNVMIVDTQMSIIYMNDAMIEMLRTTEQNLQREFPSFDAQKLLGENIGVLYEDAEKESLRLSSLTDSATVDRTISECHLRITANPVYDSCGERLGTVLEWVNRTEEVSIEQEIQDIVDATLVGDLSKRLDLQGKQGFYRKLSESINELVLVSDGVIADTVDVLSSMSHGDLTKKIDADYQGSFEHLKQGANSTMEKLTSIMNEIRGSTDIVIQASHEIANGNLELYHRTEEQTSTLKETTASVAEMTITVRKNSDNANEANNIATTTREQAEQGGSVINNTVLAMDKITESSNKIADIIRVIDDIAFQTNLLALNAAVEAARAGEQGRGFAVVASEVGNLAGRSAHAAKEIKDLIEDSVTKVDEGSKLVSTSGEVFNEIAESIKKVSGIIAEIADSGQDQANGIEQINVAVSQMGKVTQKNIKMVEEASVASKSMDEQANKLNNLVGIFKTHGIDTHDNFKQQQNVPNRQVATG